MDALGKCFFCVLEYKQQTHGNIRTAWTMYKGTPLCDYHIMKWKELDYPYMINEGM